MTASMMAALAALPGASAGAQTTVLDEATGEACPPVSLSGHAVTGGCRFTIASEQETLFVVGTAGGPIVTSACEESFDAAIDSAGEGYIYAFDSQSHDVGAPCTRVACDEAAPSHAQIPWRIHVRENPDVMNISFCLRQQSSGEGAGGIVCTWNMPWTQASSPHELEFNAEAGVGCSNLPPGALNIFSHWHSEPGSVEEGIQVLDEGTSQPCSAVSLGADHDVTGGCRVRMVGEQETLIVRSTATGPVTISTCEDDLEAAFDSAGEGYVYSIGMAGHAMSGLCTRTPCDEEDAHPHPDIPWRAHIRGPRGDERLDLSLCLRQAVLEEGSPGTPCDLSLPISQSTNPHRMHIDAEAGVPCTNLLPVGTVTFYGHWHTQAASAPHTELDIEHLRPSAEVEVVH